MSWLQCQNDGYSVGSFLDSKEMIILSFNVISGTFYRPELEFVDVIDLNV